MNIQSTQSNYQAPNFKGDLYKLPANLKPGQRRYIAEQIPVLTGGFATVKGDFLAVFGNFSKVVSRALESVHLSIQPKSLPDKELLQNVDSIEQLGAKYFPTNG